MNRLLKKLELFETLDLELKISHEDVSDSLKKISDAEQITILGISPLRQVDYKGTYGMVNQKNRLPIHFDIYPRHYIIFTIMLFLSTITISIIGIGLAIISFSVSEFITAFGIIAFYFLMLFVFTIRPLKRMQWKVWDLRLALEKELRKREKQLMTTDIKSKD
jgi:hypothetical protein